MDDLVDLCIPALDGGANDDARQLLRFNIAKRAQTTEQARLQGEESKAKTAREEEAARAKDAEDYKRMLADQCMAKLQVEQRTELDLLRAYEQDIGQGLSIIGDEHAALDADLMAKPVDLKIEGPYAMAVQELQLRRQSVPSRDTTIDSQAYGPVTC